MSKVCFLDIDGVIATNESLYVAMANYYGVPEGKLYRERIHEAFDTSNLPRMMLSGDCWPFSHHAIRQVYRLLRETNCEFVVSSSWRYSDSPEDIRRLEYLFNAKGLHIRLRDVTKRSKEAIRGLEIQEWLDRHPDITTYVILDDEAFDIAQHHPKNLVQSTQQLGFTKPLCDQAIAILNA
ncbi:HAD domain-containing protein [Hymenobacter glacieicola]|uniref:Uncharacterized protein n=1 Tax=Hymenobacter glacieicola TaxID=1562124 RepID=A0ABQ1X5Q9_9BACT|nr:HAD domain-containing protein [Hymenobacter glacieicola]GGG61190.1 hypothetical protein GCM10011378_41500 [Hymenobacter glacieicola]